MKFGKKSTTSSKKEFDSKPVYNEKYNNGKINKNLHNNKIPIEDSQFIRLSVILVDSVYRKDKNCYPQVLFLEECKYVVKEKRRQILLLMTWKFLLMILIKKKNLMKKIPMKKIKYRKCFLEKYKNFFRFGTTNMRKTLEIFDFWALEAPS